MGTSKGYGTSTNQSYGGNYSGSSGLKSRPSYERRYSSNIGSVMDRIKKFSSDNPPSDRYSREKSITPRDKSSSAVLNRYPSRDTRVSTSALDRYQPADRYSSTRTTNSDPYGNKSGYASDYGGSTRSYGSWDRASSLSGMSYGGVNRSRESSPYSSRSSRYDQSSSASKYSSYSNKSSSDVSGRGNKITEVSKRYERSLSANNYDRPRSMDIGVDYSRRYAGNVAPSKRVTASPSPSSFSRQSSREVEMPSRRQKEPDPETDSEDSAPEAEKENQSVRYLVCRGTSPIPDDTTERPKRERNRGNAIAKTRRVKKETPKPEPRWRRTKGPKMVECGCQTQEERAPESPRATKDDDDDKYSRRSRSTKDSSTAPGETFYKYKDRFLSSNVKPTTSSYEISRLSQSKKDDYPSRRSGYIDGTVSDAPVERSWRKSVYGETPKPTRNSSRYSRPTVDDTETDMTSAMEDDEDRSSMYSRRKKIHPRTSTPKSNKYADSDADLSEYASGRENTRQMSKWEKRLLGSDRDYLPGVSRSASRDNILDDKAHRNRHYAETEGSMAAKLDKAPLTPENLSLKDSIDKVQQWRQNLPKDMSSRDVSPNRNKHRNSRVQAMQAKFSRQESARSTKEESPTPFSRDASPNRRTQFKPHSHPSKGNMYDEPLDDANDGMLPNKDFRKSDLNKADLRRRHEKSPQPFERDLSPNEKRNRGQYRRGDERNTTKTKTRGSGSSSDAFSRDESPNSRLRHAQSRQMKRDSSRENILEEESDNMGQRSSRRDAWENENIQCSDNGSHAGFSREESPNRGYGKLSQAGRQTRQSSIEDILDENGVGNRNQRNNHSDQRILQRQLSNDNKTDKKKVSGVPYFPLGDRIKGFEVKNGEEERYGKKKQDERSSNGQQGMLDDPNSQQNIDPRYNQRQLSPYDNMRQPHVQNQVGVSNESLARISNAASMNSINSVYTNATDDATIRNTGSLSSLQSADLNRDDRRMAQSMSQHSIASSNGTLPDIIPGSQLDMGKPPRGRGEESKRKSGFISQVSDIDSLLDQGSSDKSARQRRNKDVFLNPINELSKSNESILDDPIPETCHYPLQPSPATGHSAANKQANGTAANKDKSVTQRHAFNVFNKNTSQENAAGNQEVNKTQSYTNTSEEVNKLVEVEDQKYKRQGSSSSTETKSPQPGYVEPPRSGHSMKLIQVKPPTMPQLMWSLLEQKQGLVTVGDVMRLCEKDQRTKPTFNDRDDSNFKGYSTAQELLENTGVDTKKVCIAFFPDFRFKLATSGMCVHACFEFICFPVNKVHSSTIYLHYINSSVLILKDDIRYIESIKGMMLFIPYVFYVSQIMANILECRI